MVAALQSSSLISSSTLRAPVSQAARAENAALHQRHRDRERERQREKSPSLTGKAVPVPLLTGCAGPWNKAQLPPKQSWGELSPSPGRVCGAAFHEEPPSKLLSQPRHLWHLQRGKEAVPACCLEMRAAVLAWLGRGQGRLGQMVLHRLGLCPISVPSAPCPWHPAVGWLSCALFSHPCRSLCQ